MPAEVIEGQGGHATEPWTSRWSPVPERGCQSSLEAPPAKVKRRDEHHDISSKETPPALGMLRLILPMYQPPPTTTSLQGHGEEAAATIRLSRNDLALGGCRAGEEAMAIPNDMAGLLKGHLVDLFIGKTRFFGLDNPARQICWNKFLQPHTPTAHGLLRT